MMKNLYLILNFATLIIPFIASFYPKYPFYKNWKVAFKAIFISAFLFILWDFFYTYLAVWGFNPKYITGINIFNLPIEEMLFFFCIPYASLFTYFALKSLIKLNPLQKHENNISNLLLIFLVIFGSFHFPKLYTSFTCLGLAMFLIYLKFIHKASFLADFYLMFFFILIPFFIVNGILTGSFIPEEIVWYNDAENSKIRMFTIPFEDTFYGMFLLLLNVFLYELLKTQKTRIKK